MAKKNNKGFTMVELLAAMTILGLLMSVAIISITRLMDKSKREYYKNQNDNIILATQSYIQNNTNRLPKNIGQKVNLKLIELLNSKYLKEKIKDYGKNTCDMSESYVEIVKVSEKDYSYNVILKCPAYDSLEDPNIDEKSPNINIKFSKEPETYANIEITGNDRIISYSYIIYSKKTSSDSYIQVKNSGSVAVKSKESVNLKIDLSSYVPSDIKLQVSATNSYGKTKNVNSKKVYITSKGPQCIYGKYQYKKGSKNHLEWTNQSRVVSIGCTSSEVGCEQDIYTQTFSSSAEYGVITIKDKAGNSTECMVQVYVDKTPPKCSSSGGKDTWSKSLTLTGKCSDSLSGCVDKNIDGRTYKNGNVSWEIKTNMLQNNVSPGVVYDAAGNATTCPADQNVMVDSVKPQIEITNPTKEAWTNKDIVLTLNSKDDLSGIAYHQYSYRENEKKDWTTYKDSAKTVFQTTPFSKERNEHAFLRVCDNAGNCTEASTMIRIDKTPPKCSSSGGGTGWAKERTLVGNCTDSGSGCKNVSASDRTYSNGNVNWLINWQGSWTNLSPGTVYDVAGNSTSCPSNQTVKIDLERPKIISIVNPHEGSWTNQPYEIKIKAEDGLSGIESYQYSYDQVSWKIDKSSSNTYLKEISGNQNRPIYFRVCDVAGNCSSVARSMIMIDTSVPTININTGTHDLKSTGKVYNVTFGSSGGSVRCYNVTNGNSSVTTYNSINMLGRHEIRCEAHGNNGSVKTASGYIVINYNGFTANSPYYKLSATGSAFISGDKVILYQGGTQYGPYVKIGKGCYHVWYYGRNLNAYPQGYDAVSELGTRNFTIKRFNYLSSDSNYYVYIPGTITNFETRIINNFPTTIEVHSINITYDSTSC